MAGQHRRAARRERQAADLFGTVRVKKKDRYDAVPDVLPVRLASGEVLSIEVKTFGNGLKKVRDALDQARRYTPSAVPVAVCSKTGEEPVACLPAKDLARVLGLSELGEAPRQLALLARLVE